MQDWILLQTGIIIYITLFAMLMGGAIGLPFPEDLPLILAGVLIHRGNINMQAAFIVCYTGIILGDLVIYFAGRRLGPKLYNQKFIKGRVSPSRIRWIKLNLEKRSFLTIFIARHLFYLRTFTFLTCGAVKMNFGKFLLADMGAAFVSAPLMMWLGYVGSEHYEQIIEFFGHIKNVSLVLGIFIAVAGYILYRRKYAKKAEEQE